MTNTTSTIYSIPNCVQCKMTKRMYVENELPFEYIELDPMSAEADEVRSKYAQPGQPMQMPIVIHGEDQWNGFQPPKIQALLA